ncbi:MAG: hypothetical protein QM831_44050 [Kofleriaceae bacterium]
MRITDNGMTVDLEDDDPRVVRIRSILFNQPPTNPIAALWDEARTEHRAILTALASTGGMAQSELEKAVHVNAVELRGLHGGLAKIAKRLGVDYPIRSVGAHRPTRRFSLDTDVAKQVLKLSRKAKP